MERIPEKHERGKSNVLLGFFLLLVGGILLLRALDYAIPGWIFSWQLLLVAIGIFIGIKSNFSNYGWLVLVLIGSVFLAPDIFPAFRWHSYMWPLAFIILGLVLIFRTSRRSRQKELSAGSYETGSPSNEEVLDMVSIFGGQKKIILAKNFAGGEIVNVFGGSEVNLTQADFQTPIAIEITNIFGGAKLVVPSNWEIKSDMVAIFGGIDDKRTIQTGNTSEKVVIVRGVSIFGGISLSSF